MGIDSDQDDIRLERCPDLVIKIDTPKGENLLLTYLGTSALTKVQVAESSPPKTYQREPS
jgi:hypothetical protein